MVLFFGSRRYETVKSFRSMDIAYVIYTAGTRWCFPWRNLFLDMFCNFQTIFLMETQKIHPALQVSIKETLKVLDKKIVFL